MRYVAQGTFSAQIPNTREVIHYKPGDTIVEFEEWPELARWSHLKMGLVQPNFSDGEATHPDALRHTQHLKATKEARARAAEWAATHENAAKPAPSEAAEVIDEAAADEAAAGAVLIACPLCPKKFRGEVALGRHRARAHAGL